jgi:alpha-galactosidase
MPLVRTASGASRNLRNDAIYDRSGDWLLQVQTSGNVKILPLASGSPTAPAASAAFSLLLSGDGGSCEFVYSPHFYRKHRGLAFFDPGSYRVRRDSIAGWCSWWAYRADFSRRDLESVLSVFREKRLADFGYRFIQIDDAYQGGSGTPRSWLEWNERFPGGMEEYARLVRASGFEPGVWIGAFFKDESIVRDHPEWFVRAPDGTSVRGPWIDWAIDASRSEAAEALVRPTYRGFRNAGFSYVKIDTLRHLLYDAIHHAPEYGRDRGLSAAEIFRAYLSVAREELGPDPFVLACWGVLPEAAGIADGCRLGTDGFGPSTLQQYNSFNGVVWRNDPDHCDISGGSGTRAESIFRPTLVSMAGAMLLLSDRAEVYRKDEFLEGVKRASPILFTVPGQLYDVDPRKSNVLASRERSEIQSGGPPSPVDADQFGNLCPWWLLEIDRPYEHWYILSRFNDSKEASGEERVSLDDLGLEPGAQYLVYEFWTKRFIGSFHDHFRAEALGPHETRTWAIRRQLDRPQVVSTNRHISQGGMDLLEVTWDAPSRKLSGRSLVVAEDSYELRIRAPEGFEVSGTAIDGANEAPIPRVLDRLIVLGVTPQKTGTLAWSVSFAGKP